MKVSTEYKKAAIALVLIFGLAALLTSCAVIHKSGDDRLAGYGKAPKSIKGPSR